MSGDTLFPLEPLPEPEKLSTDARRTRRQRVQIEAGKHPVTGGPIREDGETCGSCSHSYVRSVSAKRYWKCELVPETSGPGTDIRLKWPGCSKWEPK